MNNSEWFEEIKTLDEADLYYDVYSVLMERRRIIAYCEELREREIGWTMTLSSLEEENEKLIDANRILKEERDALNTAVGYLMHKDRWIGT